MDEYAWLAICFIVFVAITYKFIIRAISNIIKTSEDFISTTIKDAEKIYLEAKEKNEEAKALFAQLELSKKYILQKEDREIEFDINAKKQALEEAIEVKKQQLQNQINRELRNLKNQTIVTHVEKLKQKFISHLEKDQGLADHYTNLMLDITQSH
jgi:F0F1-type ATP synthase membrane subunit b/b'